MRRRKIARAMSVAAASCALLASTLVVSVQTASAATEVFASPQGTGTACSVSDPCSIETAFGTAASGSIVHLAAGDYGSAADPIPTDLASSMISDVSGPSAAHPARIFLGFDIGMLLDSNFPHLANVSIVYSGTGFGLEIGAGGQIDHTSVVASKGSACEIGDSSMSDSLCATEGTNQTAIQAGCFSGSATTATFRGITAVATGPNSVGFDDAPGNCHYDIGITNSIVDGTEYGIRLDTTATGSETTVTASGLDMVNFIRTPSDGDSEFSGTDVIVTAPHFVSASAGDFREALSSPTLDVGVADPPGDTDVAGHPRTIGSKPDFGAYERLERAAVGLLAVTHRGRHSLSVHVQVNSERLATSLRLLGVRHGLAHHSTTKAAAMVAAPRSYTLTLTGLKPNKRYRLQVIARNIAGRVASTPRSGRTD